VIVCSTVYFLVKILKGYGRLSIGTMRAQRMLLMKDTMFDKLNSFKQLNDENAESMYS